MRSERAPRGNRQEAAQTNRVMGARDNCLLAPCARDNSLLARLRLSSGVLHVVRQPDVLTNGELVGQEKELKDPNIDTSG